MATLPVIGVVRKTKEFKNRRESDICDFKKLYRFTKPNLEWLVDHFLGEKQERRGGALNSYEQMKVFLRYVSDPGFQVGVGEDIGVEQSTVSKTVDYVRQKIVEKADLWIKFPSNPAEAQKAKEIWQSYNKIPCVIGAIDCTHIRIPKPGQTLHGDEYINRKNFASINVQATCDGREWFTSVDASWPGSVHDNRVFKNSKIQQTLRSLTESSTTVLIGDSGYGSAPWVIVPFKKPTTPAQKHYNVIYAKERVIIERCFGQVKRRFPMMHFGSRVKLSRIPGMIIACFVLHNCAKYLQDDDDFPDLPFESFDDDEQFEDVPEDLSKAQIKAKGEQIRDNIANILINLN